MLMDIIKKGIALGSVTGLLITLVDGLFMLTPNIYVPYSYPFHLLLFNFLFWTAFGSISGILLWIYSRNSSDFLEKENLYWVLFFLLPFALIYGLLGRIFIPLLHSIHEVNTATHVFDRHLSFVWVLLIITFLAIYFRKYGNRKKHPTPFFIFETATFVLLFQFCSNLLRIETIQMFYFKYQNFFQNIKMESLQYMIIVYIVGILIIAVLYFIVFHIIGSLRNEIFTGKNYLFPVILFVIVAVSLTLFFPDNHEKYSEKDFSPAATGQKKEAGEISQIILIVLDTVRADRMSVYGNSGTTENLEEFSKDAVVFKNCIASSSWTLPSHASLFTGLYPSEHGSHSIIDSKNRLTDKSSGHFTPHRALSSEFVTLAELFRDNGYKTGAVVSNRAYLHPGTGLEQGFQIYNSLGNIGLVCRTTPFQPIFYFFCYITNIATKYILPYRPADYINSESLHLLDILAPSPFFLFINYMDAHEPYHPPPPFDGRSLGTSFPHAYKFKQYFLHFTNMLDKKSLSSYKLYKYDEEITFLDDQLGNLFARLKRQNIYDSSLIIVTSDHGQLFGEHGIYGHKTLLYEGAVRVPLIIKYPYSKTVGFENKNIILSDLFFTIISTCELPVPDDISKKFYRSNLSPVVSEYFNCEIGKHRVLYDGKYKYMNYENKKSSELYNLENFPAEESNLALKLPEIVNKMDKKLKGWEEKYKPKYTSPTTQNAPISQEVLEGLKAMGYIQ